jgi:hypothetical protein
MADTFGSTNVPAQYQSEVLVAAQRWDISPAILAAQLDAESGFNPNSVSPAGAVGIAQFLPSTAKDLGIDPWNTTQAIDGMAMLDAKYVKQFGSIDLALAAYNAGPGAVSKYEGVPPYAETQNYVKKILAAAGNAVSGGIADLPTGLPGVSDPTPALTSMFEHLTDGTFWKRVGFGMLAVGILVVGIYFLLKKKDGSFQVDRKLVNKG